MSSHTWLLTSLVKVYQQVSLVPTHDASVGSLLFTFPLNPGPLAAIPAGRE